MKNFDLNFRKFQVTNKTAFLEHSEKTTALGVLEFLDISYRKFPFRLTFLLEFPEFSVERVRFSEKQQFPDFLETLPGAFLTICSRLYILGILGWIERAHSKTNTNWLRISTATNPAMRGSLPWTEVFLKKDTPLVKVMELYWPKLSWYVISFHLFTTLYHETWCVSYKIWSPALKTRSVSDLSRDLFLL